MKYVIVIPDVDYYLWQTLVQITNFRDVGIEKDVIYICGYFKENPSTRLLSLVNSSDLKCKFYLYKDERPSKKYSSSLRLHLLYRFYKDNPEFQRETICYMDPDVVFSRTPNFDKFLTDDIWYISDSRSYTNAKYIRSKGEDILDAMCEVVGIDKQKVLDNEENAGGVQYILKNVSPDFWLKAYRDSENLYFKTKELGNIKVAERKKNIENLLEEEEKKLGRKLTEDEAKTFNKKNPPYHRLQEWCADMWSILWNAWYFDKDIRIDADLNFCWAGHKRNDWDLKVWFHNAGVPKEDGRNFCKVTYQKSPFKKEINVSEESASYNYLQLIKRTESTFPELIWD